MTTRESLYIVWKTVAAKAIQRGNLHFEDVPIEESWKTFEGFYEDNVSRYYRAKTKWKNYQRITPVNNTVKYKMTHIIFIRKVPGLGFTKKNTCFTSASDRMKFHKTSRKIMLDKKVLGTRDVLNILKKKGIPISGIQVISSRMSKGESPFMKNNRLRKWFRNGKYSSLIEIAKEEGVPYTFLALKVSSKKLELEDAIKHCRDYVRKLYLFEEKQLLPHEICKILSKRHNIKESVMLSRFYRYGFDINKMIIKKSTSKYAPYPKKVIAEKEGSKLEFNSIRDAARKLGLTNGNVSRYVNGKGRLKGYSFTLCSEEEGK